MSEPTTASPVTLASLEKIIVHHGQLFEEVFKRFDKMDQERREDREQHDEERRNDMQERERERLQREKDMQEREKERLEREKEKEERKEERWEREKEKQERKEEKRKKQEKKDDDIRKLEEEKAQMWQILDDGEYIKFFSRLVWTHKGRVCYYYSTNHVKSE